MRLANASGRPPRLGLNKRVRRRRGPRPNANRLRRLRKPTAVILQRLSNHVDQSQKRVVSALRIHALHRSNSLQNSVLTPKPAHRVVQYHRGALRQLTITIWIWRKRQGVPPMPKNGAQKAGQSCWKLQRLIVLMSKDMNNSPVHS